MNGYFQMFPPGWTVLEIPEVCPVCDKPVPRSFALFWNGNNYEQLPMLNGIIVSPDVFCYGHTSVECPECGWMVPQGYHTEEECQRLGQICDKKKAEVPEAFHKAFEKEENISMEGLTEGRIVHYVLSNGEHRPAIVVRNWSNSDIPGSDGMVNLIVFADGLNDARVVSGSVSEQGLFWATSAHYDSVGTKHHTWHWIEKA